MGGPLFPVTQDKEKGRRGFSRAGGGSVSLNSSFSLGDRGPLSSPECLALSSLHVSLPPNEWGWEEVTLQSPRGNLEPVCSALMLLSCSGLRRSENGPYTHL